MSSKVIKTPTVRIAVFNSLFFRSVNHSGNVKWDANEQGGRIVRRNIKGQFCTIPFAVVSR